MKKAHDIRPFGVRFVWCEVISSSFLFGAFFSSLGMSLAMLGLAALLLHFLFSQYANTKIISASVTLLWLITTFLWGSWLDEVAATSYITIILSILVTCISFWANIQILQWPEIDQWFHTHQSKD